jgi:pimeloyl-ACP methyl ester carboxylesterase
MEASDMTAADPRELVIALHCSGANAGEWRKLAETLGEGYELIAPEHYGCESAGPWHGGHAFALADEAARTIALIDATSRKVHLVGHSYGGAVALHVALARPHRIASLTLYEPCAFFLLRQFAHGAEPFAEIRAIGLAAANGVVTGDYRGAAKTFVDYWSGPGTWDATRPTIQDGLIAWMPTASLEFAALFSEPTPAAAFKRLDMPSLIIRGEHAPLPTRVVADILLGAIRGAALEEVAGAGHMGPITHAADVNALIVRHIARCQTFRAAA